MMMGCYFRAREDAAVKWCWIRASVWSAMGFPKAARDTDEMLRNKLKNKQKTVKQLEAVTLPSVALPETVRHHDSTLCLSRGVSSCGLRQGGWVKLGPPNRKGA